MFPFHPGFKKRVFLFYLFFSSSSNAPAKAFSGKIKKREGRGKGKRSPNFFYYPIKNQGQFKKKPDFSKILGGWDLGPGAGIFFKYLCDYEPFCKIFPFMNNLQFFSKGLIKKNPFDWFFGHLMVSWESFCWGKTDFFTHPAPTKNFSPLWKRVFTF